LDAGALTPIQTEIGACGDYWIWTSVKLLSIYSMLTKLFMLPDEQILIWQQLFNLLSNLPPDNTSELKANLNLAIELFESEILTQNIDRLPDPIAGKMRSYLTESHRLLRLLSMDVMFIAAARHPTTNQQRFQAYQTNLNLLLQYCQAVINSG
jgi:hypothetical protein